MSIYSTWWVLKFPRYGDSHTGCEWVEVIGQGVPAHIGSPTPGQGYEARDPYCDFLPPAVSVPSDDDGQLLRAMVVVRDGTPKEGQRYVDPLLTLSGVEYAATPFPVLHERIGNALRGTRPRWIGEWTNSRGQTCLMFDDGSVRVVETEVGTDPPVT